MKYQFFLQDDNIGEFDTDKMAGAYEENSNVLIEFTKSLAKQVQFDNTLLSMFDEGLIEFKNDNIEEFRRIANEQKELLETLRKFLKSKEGKSK